MLGGKSRTMLNLDGAYFQIQNRPLSIFSISFTFSYLLGGESRTTLNLDETIFQIKRDHFLFKSVENGFIIKA